MTAARLTATYRVQLNARFTLRDALGIVPYLERLGISHLYCSPVLAARAGSTHGYDVIDPTRVNPELGTEDDLRALAAALHERQMGLVLDIVPNHMAASAENAYWDDVLLRGRGSPYASWFDIDWPATGRQCVILPMLGDTLDNVIARLEFSFLGDSPQRSRLSYFGTSFPIDPASMPPLGIPELLKGQRYRLTHWKNPGNYRRFFDVNDLVALRQEDERVFEATHALVLRWIHEGVVDGLRVDHVDGLANPRQYLDRLRTRGVRLLFVEKILADGEQLPVGWPVAGTTGYDALNDLDDLFLDPGGMSELVSLYARRRRLGPRGFRDVAFDAKLRVLATSMRGDVRHLSRELVAMAESRGRPMLLPDARMATTRWIAALPVYRLYFVAGEAPSDRDRDLIEETTATALTRAPAQAAEIQLLRDVLLETNARADAVREDFVRRLQQLTSAAAAKGIEDSAFYQYLPLVSRNEVGGSPDRALSRDAAVERFHRNCTSRARHWPLGLTCTTTHDTKRSADVRARLAALTEINAEWERALFRWRRLNRRFRQRVQGRLVPDTNTEYLFYQTLVGIWPGPTPHRRLDDLPDAMTLDSMAARMGTYMRKAAREAKVHTSWREPNPAYEDALGAFVRGAFERLTDEMLFLRDVARIVGLAGSIGHWNSLARVALHLTEPGTPDLYQGDELRDLELVDPDNRHDLNFEFLARTLSETGDAPDARDHRFKFFLVHRLLCLRRSEPTLFESGAYVPLHAEGPRSAHVVAFARASEEAVSITIAPRLSREFVALKHEALAEYWRATDLVLPSALAAHRYRDVLSGSTIAPVGERLALSSVFIHLPVAVLVSR